MSHFTVTVALPAEVPADPDALYKALTEALAPFDENIEMPRYVEYTKQGLIDKAKADREAYRTGPYAQYLSDPVDYAAKCHNPQHMAYLDGTAKDGGFPAKLLWTDEQLYADEVRWREDVGPDGEVYSTYNPRSEWDWWVVGGRWGGMWRFKSAVDYDYIKTEESAFGFADDADKELATDCGRVGDIAPETIDSAWGYIDLAGEWNEKGDMGWWGLSDADESDEGQLRWKKQYLDWIASLPKDAWIINCDCHI